MNSSRIKIGIIGLGMVGEPIKKWFEEFKGYERGKDLFCYDVDTKKGYSDDVNKSDVVFVSVPTPPNHDGSCNTSVVESAVARIKDGKIIVVKSTITPGTLEKLQKKYPKKRLIFNPEFLTESQAWLDFLKPDRQLVAFTKKSHSDSKEVLALLPPAPFVRPWQLDYSTKKQVNATEAEISKYAANVFGYIKVVYGNILADIVYALNHDFKENKIDATVDYENIREVVSADGRIGPAWLNVSYGNYCGAGGYCFPKDMNAFIAFAETLEKDSAKKKLLDKEHRKLLQGGITVLKAVRNYNEVLIKSQGLSMGDVSKHDKEVIVHKRKEIRKFLIK